jgi:ABC-type multidrug transport system ATPase subunit
MELTISSVSKRYGPKLALKDFSAEMKQGVYGILGPNGAGKTTLMNIITDNIAPSAGAVLYNGADIRKLGKDFRSILGYMPQQQGIYNNFTAKRFLWYMAALKGLKRREAKERIDYLLELVNLKDSAHRKLGGFSGGMKQRVLLAQALLNDPKLLVLDEPTAGLDPRERIKIRNFISTIAFDKIVLLATHVVPDIEYIATEVILLSHGETVCRKPPVEILDGMRGKVFEVLCREEDVPALTSACKVSNITKEKSGVCMRVVGEPPKGFDCAPVKPNLEDVYLHLLDE